MNQRRCVCDPFFVLPVSFSLFLTQFRFDLYAHSWLVLDETEQISMTDGTVINSSTSSRVVDADHGGRRTAGGGSSLLPSSWRQHGSSSQSGKYNAVGVRSGTPIQQKLSASAASLLLTGFATISEKTETVPWRCVFFYFYFVHSVCRFQKIFLFLNSICFFSSISSKSSSLFILYFN